MTSRTGNTTASLISAVDRWVSGSNSRKDSMVSPKNSMRTGFSWSGEKKSMIPPRRLNSPTRVTSDADS